MRLRRIDAEAKTHLFQLGSGHHWRFAAFKDIDQGRTGYATADNSQLFDVLGRLDKADIRTRFKIGVDPVDRSIEPFDRARVRAGDEDHGRVLTGIDGS